VTYLAINRECEKMEHTNLHHHMVEWRLKNEPMQGAYGQFAEHIEKDTINTIVELGSRDGLDAIWLHKEYDAQVVCWECNPAVLDIVRRNIQFYEDVELVDLAVWSKDTSLTFHPVTNGNVGASSVFQANTDYPHEKYVQEEIQVNARRLDGWWKENRTGRALDMLVMDLQGGELEALKGAEGILDSIRYIITEGQYQQLYHDTPLIQDIQDYLKNKGFKLVAEKIHVPEWFGDFLFIREDAI
jgi:FkbM family methyltransferase